MAMEANYYEILDVPKDANAELIREAYKKMAIKWHPDKNMDNKDEADARFKQIAQSYQVLSDKEKRQRYDRSQNSDDEYSDDSLDDYFGFFMTPDILFRHFFRQFSQDLQDMQYNRRWTNNRSAKNDRRPNARRHEHRCYNDASSTKPSSQSSTQPTTSNRVVNGKRWVTKKYYEDGKEIITRHEDGELVSKHIDGVAQHVSRK